MSSSVHVIHGPRSRPAIQRTDGLKPGHLTTGKNKGEAEPGRPAFVVMGSLVPVVLETGSCFFVDWTFCVGFSGFLFYVCMAVF